MDNRNLADISIALSLAVIAVKVLFDDYRRKDKRDDELIERFYSEQMQTIQKLRQYLDENLDTVRQIRESLELVEQRITKRQTEILVMVSEKIMKLLVATEAVHRRLDDDHPTAPADKNSLQ